MSQAQSPPARMQTVAQLVADCLARHGVEVMFSQCLPSAVLHAAEDIQIKHFLYRTENAGAAMADGYARVTGKVGVVSAQNGPAATLLVPGLAEALKVSVPIVAIVQDVSRRETDRNAFQELDHIALFQGCTKWVRRVSEANRVADYIDMAFATAASGRPGPVVLLLPADLLLEKIDVSHARKSDLGRYPLDRMMADPARLDEAASVLAAARLPLIVAGGGVHLSDACAQLAALQQQCHIPVMTTVMGKGSVDERHPLSLGVTGYALGKLAPGHHMKAIIDDADVILLVGTRTNQNATDSWKLYPKSARFIHIDVDGGEIGRNYESMRLGGDARLTLAALPAGLGWGLPLAIGAKSGHPNRPVLCMVGDGGFAHVWSELETAHRRQTPIVVTVLNNGCLGYQKDAEDVKFDRHSDQCFFSPVDHAAIARAMTSRAHQQERAVV